MGTAGEKNLWAEWISTSPSLHSTPSPLLSFPPSLHHAVCCCAYVLNNNCLSGSFVGQKLWRRDHVRAGERLRDGSRRGNDVKLHGNRDRRTFQFGRGGNTECRKNKGNEWFTEFTELKPHNLVSQGGQTCCQHHRMLSCSGSRTKVLFNTMTFYTITSHTQVSRKVISEKRLHLVPLKFFFHFLNASHIKLFKMFK